MMLRIVFLKNFKVNKISIHLLWSSTLLTLSYTYSSFMGIFVKRLKFFPETKLAD